MLGEYCKRDKATVSASPEHRAAPCGEETQSGDGAHGSCKATSWERINQTDRGWWRLLYQDIVCPASCLSREKITTAVWGEKQLTKKKI